MSSAFRGTKLLGALALVCGSSALNKSITLDPDHLGAPGIGVNIYTNHVDIVDGAWHLEPESQDGIDLELQMNAAWGFHADLVSTVTLTMNGSTPNNTLSNAELLILFGVGNS